MIPEPENVAFPGELGAFSEEAITALWPRATPIPASSARDVARAVAEGRADAGVLPVENSVAGGVVASYDALADESELYAVAETILAIRQCLAGIHGATLDDIELVESHPVALAQCSMFLRGLPRARQLATADTAGAAHAVAELRDRRHAAVCGRKAAARYGLAILADHIEDRPDNQTRFLAVARNRATVATGVRARTSLVFETANEPGALLRALEPIAKEELNLSKLESRPTGQPWTYRFFADVDHEAGDPRIEAAMAALTQATRTCRVLGTYARARS